MGSMTIQWCKGQILNIWLIEENNLISDGFTFLIVLRLSDRSVLLKTGTLEHLICFYRPYTYSIQCKNSFGNLRGKDIFLYSLSAFNWLSLSLIYMLLHSSLQICYCMTVIACECAYLCLCLSVFLSGKKKHRKGTIKRPKGSFHLFFSRKHATR